MLSGGDYMSPPLPPYAVSGGDGETLHQAGEGTGTPGGNVSPAPDAVSGSDAFPGIFTMLSGMGSSGEETALYAGTETVSGNGADALQVVSAVQEGFAVVCMLLGFIAGILFMKGFFIWKARE